MAEGYINNSLKIKVDKIELLSSGGISDPPKVKHPCPNYASAATDPDTKILPAPRETSTQAPKINLLEKWKQSFTLIVGSMPERA